MSLPPGWPFWLTNDDCPALSSQPAWLGTVLAGPCMMTAANAAMRSLHHCWNATGSYGLRFKHPLLVQVNDLLSNSPCSKSMHHVEHRCRY